MAPGPNQVMNAGFEAGATDWILYGGGFMIEDAMALGGTRSTYVSGRQQPGSMPGDDPCIRCTRLKPALAILQSRCLP
jgi:hypothetical protein